MSTSPVGGIRWRRCSSPVMIGVATVHHGSAGRFEAEAGSRLGPR